MRSPAWARGGGGSQHYPLSARLSFLGNAPARWRNAIRPRLRVMLTRHGSSLQMTGDCSALHCPDSSLCVIPGAARLRVCSPSPCPVSHDITASTSSDSQSPRLLWAGTELKDIPGAGTAPSRAVLQACPAQLWGGKEHSFPPSLPTSWPCALLAFGAQVSPQQPRSPGIKGHVCWR